MNNNFSLEQTSKTSIFDANLKIRQYKLNFNMKYENPKMKQSQIASQLGYSTSTLQRYKIDINMLSPYRIQSNNTNKRTKKSSKTNFNNNSHRQPNVKRPQRPQRTLEQLKQIQNQLEKTKVF